MSSILYMGLAPDDPKVDLAEWLKDVGFQEFARKHEGELPAVVRCRREAVDDLRAGLAGLAWRLDVGALAFGGPTAAREVWLAAAPDGAAGQ